MNIKVLPASQRIGGRYQTIWGIRSNTGLLKQTQRRNLFCNMTIFVDGLRCAMLNLCRITRIQKTKATLNTEYKCWLPSTVRAEYDSQVNKALLQGHIRYFL